MMPSRVARSAGGPGATLVWFRQDLRLADNPALLAAVERGGPVVPVYIWSPGEEGDWAPGAGTRWWIEASLAGLGADLASRGSRLIFRTGETIGALRDLVRATGASAVFWNRRHEPEVARRDGRIERLLAGDGIEVRAFNAALLFEAETVRTRAGGPFQVFTPFWRACQALPEPAPPRPVPARIPAPRHWPSPVAPVDLGPPPRADRRAGWRATWRPGEAAAGVEMERLLDVALPHYPGLRDLPDRDGTSRLSPYLHHGEIGPRQVWHAVADRAAAARRRSNGAEVGTAASAFLRQIVWREFAYHLLHHFPHTIDRPLRPAFERFPWSRDRAALRLWQEGRTGFPIVDAGMRALRTTGWMHNRVRMIAASFLVKDLRIAWTAGARWFWETLVDADLAVNTLNWQWVAGCGADAAPYFRIFNPAIQGARFDSHGVYVRRWVPEIAALPDRWIHAPEKAPQEVRRRAGVRLGGEYPRPVVDHAAARLQALAALALASGRGDRQRRAAMPARGARDKATGTRRRGHAI